MCAKLVICVADGRRTKLSKSDIVDYLSKVARFCYSNNYLRGLRRWPYDVSRFALYSFIKKHRPECLSDFINLYDPYGFK